MRRNIFVLLCVVLLKAAFLLSVAGAQSPSDAASSKLPVCIPTHAYSPDMHWALVNYHQTTNCAVPASEAGADAQANIFIATHAFLEEETSGRRWILPVNITPDTTATWAPSGQLFYFVAPDNRIIDAMLFRLNPNAAKPNAKEVFHPFDLHGMIFGSDARVRRVANEHDPFYVRMWLDQKTVLVELCSPQQDPSKHITLRDDASSAPVASFNFMYGVTLDGSLKRQDARTCSLDKVADCGCSN